MKAATAAAMDAPRRVTAMDRIWLLLDSRGMGGIESHVAELAAGLAEAGLRPEVVFLADHGPHPLRARLAAAGLPWRALPGGMRALVGALRAERPALLHSHGYKANLLGRAAARLAGVPVVATFHAGERPPGRLALYDALDRWTAFAGPRLAVSRPILARLPWGGVLAPNFVGVPGVVPGTPPPGGPPRVVGFVGRLAPEKGPDLFCRLAELAAGARFEVFGDGPERAACEALAGGRVLFHGAVPGMAGRWAGLGLLAITSRAEGLPLAALEAMAAGVPVAAFAVGGLPDLLTDGVDGFLAPPGDLAALAAAVRRWDAMGPAARAAMAAAARRTIATRHGRAAGVARVLEAYRRA